MQPDNARVRTRAGISISLLLKIKPTGARSPSFVVFLILQPYLPLLSLRVLCESAPDRCLNSILILHITIMMIRLLLTFYLFLSYLRANCLFKLFLQSMI